MDEILLARFDYRQAYKVFYGSLFLTNDSGKEINVKLSYAACLQNTCFTEYRILVWELRPNPSHSERRHVPSGGLFITLYDVFVYYF